MDKIDQNTAVALEFQLRKLFDCDRAGCFEIIDSDSFRHNPLSAVILVAAFLYLKNIDDIDNEKFSSFVSKYELLFCSDESATDDEIEEYIKGIRIIVDHCISLN